MAEEDPRRAPAPVAEVPALVAEGAGLYNDGRYWHAHEAWEDAWHALRAAGRQGDADFLQGMILVTAAFENCRRGKERGFKRQMAQGLHMLRENVGAGAGPRLGVANASEWVDAVLSVYLDACRRVKWDPWQGGDWSAPPLKVSP